MNPVIQYMLETLACSAVLLAAYAFLLEGRASFRWCRFYLIAATAASALIPLLKIPVWPGKVIMATAEVYSTPDIAYWEGFSTTVVAEKPSVITPENILAAIYLIGAAIIITLMLWQLAKIALLRRGSSVMKTERYTLVRTLREVAAFSFFRSIYIWARTPEKELGAIVAHEASHVAHRHSTERVAMGVMKALMWWNPFVWVFSKRLGEVEEFEADNDVLSSGIDRSEYMETILKQLFGYSPDIANGLHNSLTKKRFKMMTTPIKHRHSLLRMAFTLPFAIGLLCAFGFTSRAATVVYPEAAETEITAAIEEQELQQPEPPKQVGRLVTIKVSDLTDNKPLKGATIVIDGTTKGVVTDAEGKAKIMIPYSSTIFITYPGYESAPMKLSKEDLDGNNGISILMKRSANAAFAETGFTLMVRGPEGIIPANGAVVRAVSGEEIGSKAGSDGKVSIKAPAGAVLEISHEGYESIIYTVQSDSWQAYILSPAGEKSDNGGFISRDEYGVSHKPLILVDGVESNSMNNLDVNRIENISVFKDDQSTKKFGEKGKYGVILITTKNKVTLPKKSESNGQPEADEPFLTTEIMPQFPTGDPANPYGNLNAFRSWVQSHVNYPAEAMEKNISGRVVVSFVIERDGSLSNINVLQSPHKLLSEEAVRTLNSSPKWIPGKQKEQIVRVKYNLPVDFRITGGEQTDGEKPANKTEGFQPVEVAPQFPTGDAANPYGDIAAFRKWVQSNVRYPAEAINKEISGRVTMSFCVEPDGSVGNINVLQTPDRSLSEECIRVIKLSPKWKPGTQMGNPVRTQYNIPIDFRVAGGKLQSVEPPKPETPKGGTEVEGVVVVAFPPR